MERVWALRPYKIVPRTLTDKVEQLVAMPTANNIQRLSEHSPLGRIYACALRYHQLNPMALRERVQDAGRHAIHELERYLSTLGTIALIAPLLGLLGTVLGMINIFSHIMDQGVGQAQVLAGGIGTALLTTAAGLMVAIPTMAAHRYLERRVSNLTIILEQQSERFVEAIERDRYTADPKTDSVLMGERA
jgi:biopolymer transport protein ExbB